MIGLKILYSGDTLKISELFRHIEYNTTRIDMMYIHLSHNFACWLEMEKYIYHKTLGILAFDAEISQIMQIFS